MNKQEAYLYHADCLRIVPQLCREWGPAARLVYLDPPYNTGRYRGARRQFGDSRPDWSERLLAALRLAFAFLADDGFLAVSINQMELFNLKALIDAVFGTQRFIGLFPVKIRHRQRQLMINATFHDLFEYLLIYRKNRQTRFHMARKEPHSAKFRYEIDTGSSTPRVREINGKKVEIYAPGDYRINEGENGLAGFRRYIIAGKLATANWSGEWYEKHLRPLGSDLLVRVWGLEKKGLGYRWFQTGNARRRSGVYFQSLATAGRPILPANDLDFTEVVPTIYLEGGPGCDFKDSKKPEALLRFLMEICTRPGDLVADFFAGSGTTLAAGIKLNRRVLAIEADPGAFQVIRTRLDNMRQGRDGQRREFKVKIHDGKSMCG